MKATRSLCLIALVIPMLTFYALIASAQCEQFSTGGSLLYSDSCGNQEWDFYVTNAQTNEQTDLGDYNAYGTCVSPYYDCSNVYHSNPYQQGTATLKDDGPYSDYAEQFEVDTDDWVVSGYPSCDNGNPDDIDPQFANYPEISYSIVDNSCF